MVSVPQIKLGEYFRAGELVEQVVNAGDGKTIAYRNPVDRSTVHAQPPGTVLLWGRGGQGRCTDCDSRR